MSDTPSHENREAPDPFENAAVLDARSLRGLAHPLRMRVHQLLQRGPATGKAVSEKLGISSASASYHLRQLSTYGFIEEAPELGTSKERWWRSVHKGFRLPESLDTEAPELSTTVRHAMAARWAEQLSAAVNLWSSQPEGWREAQMMADRTMSLTLEQLETMREELREVLNRYSDTSDDTGTSDRQDADASGARTVNVHLAAFPSPDPEDPTGESPPDEGPEDAP